MKTESNRPYLQKVGPIATSTWEILPHFLKNEQNQIWRPEKGIWYNAESAGRIGGGWGGGGSGAWSDPGIPVLAGDKFRLVSYGTVACPTVWEVEFSSPLRNLGGRE